MSNTNLQEKRLATNTTMMFHKLYKVPVFREDIHFICTKQNQPKHQSNFYNLKNKKTFLTTLYIR